MLNSIDLSEVTDIWPAGQKNLEHAFLTFAKQMENNDGSELELIARPGLTYSLRANVPGRDRDRPLYAMVDVIVSETDPWFISACFFADDITDPDELGDEVPGGLFSQDACCFDLDDGDDSGLAAYLQHRINEAYKSAST